MANWPTRSSWTFSQLGDRFGTSGGRAAQICAKVRRLLLHPVRRRWLVGRLFETLGTFHSPLLVMPAELCAALEPMLGFVPTQDGVRSFLDDIVLLNVEDVQGLLWRLGPNAIALANRRLSRDKLLTFLPPRTAGSTESAVAEPAISAPGPLPARIARTARLTLALTPHGRLHVVPDPGRSGNPPSPAEAAALEAFALGQGRGLLHLAAAETRSHLLPVLGFWRRFGQTYLRRLCARGEVEPGPPRRIDRLLESKQRLSNELLHCDGEALLTEMSTEEMLEVVSLDLHAALEE
ncbi:MAG: hypothetical protein HY814_10825, partial [Candidatus Riflebacteria bacterium]|nr:hypothetical protein [Candidatus Riflebacteria bacterium]